jgi:hypothetical protein
VRGKRSLHKTSTHFAVDNAWSRIATLTDEQFGLEKMKAETTSRMVRRLSLAALITGMAASSFAAGMPRNEAQNSTTAIDLVRAAVANEVVAANDSSNKHMFRSRKQTPQGSQTRLYVETREAMAGMTVAYDDHPLTPEQVQGEQNRLAGLVGDPEQLKHKHSQEQETADRTLRIVKALPEAFLYEYMPDGDTANSTTSNPAKDVGQLVRLKFRPNPEYHPPSHVEQVLEGMQGLLVIDRTCNRIVTIDGTLFKQVGFGWGILGYLDKGGHFLVEQHQVADGSWQISRMSLTFKGKILLFKSIAIKSDEAFSDFRPVPAGTTFAQGVEMLKAADAKLVQVKPEAMNAEGKSR